MNVHLIAEIKITDDGWVAESATEVHKLVEKTGGRYRRILTAIQRLRAPPALT